MLAFSVGAGDTRGVLGKSDPNAELLDAAALCRHLVAEDSMHAFLADHRRELFPDELFADLFPSGRGRPSVPADVVATVMVLQALEGLSDRDAAMALRTNIAWKVAAGLALDDTGIHYSVLTYWRTRLRNSEAPERIFDAVRAVIDATGVLKGRRRRALDSTLLDDAVATQDTVTQLVAAIRRVRRLVPAAAAVDVVAHDYDASGKPVCAWDDPDAKTALVTGLVNDARAIIAALETIRDTNFVVFTVGTMEYLQKGGRIGRASAMLGSLLNIKPLLTLKDGRIEPLSRARGMKKAQQEMVERFKAYVEASAGPVVANLIHIKDAEAAASLEAALERAGVKYTLNGVHEIGAVIGSHVGPNTFGLYAHQAVASQAG